MTLPNIWTQILLWLSGRQSTREGPYFPSSVRVQSPWETITVCRSYMERQIRGAYLRFGDGDVNLLEGKGELLQEANLRLQTEMVEAFNLHGEGIVKGLMLHSKRFGLWKGMAPGVHESSDDWACSLLSRCYPFFIGHKIYSHAALAYLAIQDRAFTVDFLKYLRRLQPLLVGNKDIPALVRHQLFASDEFVPTPPQNSYADIDRIERETLAGLRLRNKPYDTVVIAMGCSGRVMAKRLINNAALNVFIFDFGSLMDALCQWNSRAWIECVDQPREYFEELLMEMNG